MSILTVGFLSLASFMAIFPLADFPSLNKNHQELRRRQRSAHELLDEELHAWLLHKTVKYSTNDMSLGFFLEILDMPCLRMALQVRYMIRYHTLQVRLLSQDNENTASQASKGCRYKHILPTLPSFICNRLCRSRPMYC